MLRSDPTSFLPQSPGVRNNRPSLTGPPNPPDPLVRLTLRFLLYVPLLIVSLF